jgi:3-polyprenyl-4-hydroxybenzoate decarboxylase
MVVCDDLIARAAISMLKERRRLVLTFAKLLLAQYISNI